MSFLLEWYKYREMFVALVGRDVRLRYRGSVLGVVWTLLSPLLQMLVYSLVFSTIMRIDVEHYSVFVFCSLLPWTWFANSLTTGSETIFQNGSLIKKIYFPTELLPLVNVTSHMINFLFALPVLAMFMVFSGMGFTPALLALPLVMVVQFFFVYSLVLLLSMLNTFYRDVSYLLGIVIMIWFYLTPVLYPLHMIPEKYFSWFLINPMLHLTHAYRTIFLMGDWPSWRGLGVVFAISVAIFAVVYPVFNRKKFEFAEVI